MSTTLHGKHISDVPGVTCNTGSYSVTCHLTKVNVPLLNPYVPTPECWNPELVIYQEVVLQEVNYTYHLSTNQQRQRTQG